MKKILLLSLCLVLIFATPIAYANDTLNNKAGQGPSAVDPSTPAMAHHPDYDGEYIYIKIGDPFMYTGNAFVDETKMELDPGRGTTAIIKDSRTLLPLRAILEQMGAEVAWNDAEKKITIDYYSDTLELFIGKTNALFNEEPYELDVPPEIINSRTMVPIRFISESFGIPIYWIDDQKAACLHIDEELIIEEDENLEDPDELTEDEDTTDDENTLDDEKNIDEEDSEDIVEEE